MIIYNAMKQTYLPYSPHVEGTAILKQLYFPLFIAAPSVTILSNLTHLLQMTVDFVVVLDGKLTILTTIELR